MTLPKPSINFGFIKGHVSSGLALLQGNATQRTTKKMVNNRMFMLPEIKTTNSTRELSFYEVDVVRPTSGML